MVDEETEPMSEEQIAEKLAQLVGTTPTPEEKQNVYTFLHNVAIADDTTKVGYLTGEEIGTPVHPIRTLKELALFCSDVANMSYYSNYLKAKSEIITSTSLSRDAKLISLAVLTKKEIAEVTKIKKKNKGWFKRKEPTAVTELT